MSTKSPSPRWAWKIGIALILLACFAAILVALGRSQESQDGHPGESVPERAVDLLETIVPAEDAVEGRFERRSGAIVTPPGQAWARLQVPYVPPEEYDLTLIVERKAGNNSLNLGLSNGTRQFMVILDGGGPEGWGFSGIDFVDGKPFFDNTTTYAGPLLPEKVRVKVNCAVRKSGVRVQVQDRSVIRWNGDVDKLFVADMWEVPAPNTLILGCFESQFRIHGLWIEFVSRPGKKLRP